MQIKEVYIRMKKNCEVYKCLIGGISRVWVQLNKLFNEMQGEYCEIFFLI